MTTFPHILAQMSAADWAGWLTLITIIAKIVTDQLNRYQDRRDAESKAELILKTLKEQEKNIKIAAAKREGRILTTINRGITKSNEAIEASNNVNAKLDRQSADMQGAIDAIEGKKDET